MKKTRSKCWRRPSRLSCSSMPNRNSNIGPPRTALGSFGFPAKPTAIVPPVISRSRSRMRSAAEMPSQGVMACSMPGSFLMKRPPVARTRPSLTTSPVLVCTVRPSSARPVTSAETKRTRWRCRKPSNGTIRSSRRRKPLGIQMMPGR
ncbi:hypothetical protein SDC9_173533 [bioreactor metagenome]|uniref:Uncharacterized protein n=1 Tax=bioreactor metagenome TaxID=1076179 RepID=A0A645GJU6_9ZZZZ